MKFTAQVDGIWMADNIADHGKLYTLIMRYKGKTWENNGIMDDQ